MLSLILLFFKNTPTTDNKYFAALHKDNVMDVDPLNDWIRSAPVITISDPIVWWTETEQTGHLLVHMALDFLSIPGELIYLLFDFALGNDIQTATSTDVECAFSQGSLTVLKMWHLLSDASTGAATVLGSWVDLPGAIPHDEINSMSQLHLRYFKLCIPAGTRQVLVLHKTCGYLLIYRSCDPHFRVTYGN